MCIRDRSTPIPAGAVDHKRSAGGRAREGCCSSRTLGASQALDASHSACGHESLCETDGPRANPSQLPAATHG
eukprot:6085427-Pyramimonas_sp.AAC.1